jgi:hypothetical protein
VASSSWTVASSSRVGVELRVASTIWWATVTLSSGARALIWGRRYGRLLETSVPHHVGPTSDSSHYALAGGALVEIVLQCNK